MTARSGEPPYGLDAWCIRESDLSLDRLARSESIFALANGHIGMRGNLDEGEPHGLPGTYLNSVYECRPLPYAEAGYGYPDSGQSVINVTNGKVIRLLVDDEPFDVRYGTLDSHERTLDLRAGTLTRDARWTSPAGSRVRVSSTRLVSFTQRAVAAICFEVEAVDDVRVVVQSELVANESLPGPSDDPRAAAALESALESQEHLAFGNRAILVHATRVSGLLMAAGMDHEIEAPGKVAVDRESFEDVARITVAATLGRGERLRLVKFLGYGWSSQRSRPALHDQVAGALAQAMLTGWDELVADQRAYLDEFWCGADVEVEGDPEVQQAVRFAVFHILQAGARAERRMIAAKGLTGPGYDGHTFWDTEAFVLPVLTYTMPGAAADALAWRHSTLPAARERAAQLGLPGAAFAWRTIHGEECSGYWPAGTAAFHINAAIADAVVRYLDATGDDDFERQFGLELLVETARMWYGLGHHDAEGAFRIDGVTGPDEYSALADNNVYTNLMARRNLRAAADSAARHPELAAALGVSDDESASWLDAADRVLIPYDERLGIHPQHEGFTDRARWDFAHTPPDRYPLLLHFPYYDLYRKQVVKQADLVLAMHLCGDQFTAAQKARNFAYYEELTVRDSSLSAQTQAVLAAEVGHLDLAYDYLAETALTDLHNLAHNTRDGLHLASLAGAWNALVAGFGGMRAEHGRLRFAPRIPESLGSLTFRVRYRGSRLRVRATGASAQYRLLEGEGLDLAHHGECFHLSPERDAVELPIPASDPPSPRPTQPSGREPARRADSRSGGSDR